MAKFDLVYNSNYSKLYEKYTRLMQICAPNLMPIHVEIVGKLEDLGGETARGTGGFGSTGI
jgi:dUTPase